MKLNFLLAISVGTAVCLGSLIPLAKAADDPDQTETMKEFQRREENLSKFSIDEQLKVRAAQQKALETPAVKEALAKRDKAIFEFRQTMRAAMIAADPSVKPILDKVAEGSAPGLGQ